jgi:hypothetical protein
VPGEVRCAGETIEVCDSRGEAWVRGTTCDAGAGLRCSAEGCVDLCAQAAADASYVGCEYWPVVTRNGSLSSRFTFALAVANPQLVPAVVTVDRGGTEVARVTVAPGALETIALPWVEELRRVDANDSNRLPRGAYHLVSDVPVVVTQFNPLEYEIEGDCMEEPPERRGDGVCYSYSNDASLLLPTHVLTGSYVVVTRPTFFARFDESPIASAPGFITIVGVAPRPVTVDILPRARISASEDGSIPAMMPGERHELVIERGEVIQLASASAERCPGATRSETLGSVRVEYCDPPPDYDLTGTIVRADGPIAVFAGHDCTFVPWDRWACDHLEEQLFPVESLGTSAFVAPTHSLRGEPNLLRIVSAADANEIRLEPPIEPPFVLGLGEYREFTIREGVRVQGTGALLAALFLVGQDYNGFGTAGSAAYGDPAMALAIPDAQYRRSYTFLAPETYRQSYVDVIAPAGSRVVLDRSIVSGWDPIGASGWVRTTVRIEPGVHRIDAASPFGITVYGFGRYTSYLVPGGLDLRPIRPPI